MLFIIGISSRTIFIATGPTVTTNRRRKNTEEDREDQFDAELGGLFFGHLARLHAHEVGVCAQALRDARAETVGLNQHGDQFL